MLYFFLLLASLKISASKSWVLVGRKRFQTRTSARNAVAEIEGVWNSEVFASTECWGKQPLLWRKGFDTGLLPSWEEICDLACSDDYEAEITSRLISHKPGTLDTYKLHFGPFISDDLESLMQNNQNHASTLVVNDVDRWIPSLSDWMDSYFAFLPRWRRDDAQVSLARVGGGIGPHVDNYDVFLVQGAGTRTWEVGLEKLSVEDEYANLVQASEVRILNVTTPSVTVELNPGDCLYLPPRVLHWGTSAADDCMTISVGCRAPSAAELLSKMSEITSSSAQALAVERYADFDLLRETNKSLSSEVKDKMKELVLDLIHSQLDDDDIWSDLVGQVVTEPIRPANDYPTSLREMDCEWRMELGIWADAAKSLEAIVEGTGVLRRAEGISFAWSGGDPGICKLYAHGHVFVLNDTSPSASILLDCLANGLPLDQNRLLDLDIELSQSMKDFLVELLEEGFLYCNDA
eukprot:scaffold91_cov127-Cylindrotheca_fusiformis.AAC.14